jgi:hypothetical protein
MSFIATALYFEKRIRLKATYWKAIEGPAPLFFKVQYDRIYYKLGFDIFKNKLLCQFVLKLAFEEIQSVHRNTGSESAYGSLPGSTQTSIK